MRALAAVGVVIAFTAAAHAQKPAAPPVIGATEVARYAAPSGFIDDPVAAEDDRIAYVIADAATKAELHVAALSRQDETVLDLAPVTLHPVQLAFVGPRVFVVGANEDGTVSAALVDPKAKRPVIYKIAAAANITVLKDRVAVHRVSAAGKTTRHDVEILALDSGRRIAAHGIELDATGFDAKLEFRVNHWSDGYTRAYGIKTGEWDKKEDQKMPDAEATLDVVTGKVLETHAIKDLFEQHKRFAVLADQKERVDFVRADKGELTLWRGGVAAPVTLDQAFTNYDPASLQFQMTADGAWIALKVDPVNPDAVARKKADLEYFDIFKVTDGKGVRRARVYAKDMRHRFGFIGGDKFWLVERNAGFERGGKNLVVYQLSGG
ncbi:MAG TPA: hypothetical protein VGM88_03370 [Kofleriaceae bacterium]